MNPLFWLITSLIVALPLFLLTLGTLVFLALRDRSRTKKMQGVKPISSLPSKKTFPFVSSGYSEEDITSYATEDIPKSGLFSAAERRMEYRRRGKSPSGVIDGVYNDMYREDGRLYSDMDRYWDADA